MQPWCPVQQMLVFLSATLLSPPLPSTRPWGELYLIVHVFMLPLKVCVSPKSTALCSVQTQLWGFAMFSVSLQEIRSQKAEECPGKIFPQIKIKSVSDLRSQHTAQRGGHPKVRLCYDQDLRWQHFMGTSPGHLKEMPAESPTTTLSHQLVGLVDNTVPRDGKV